ncbi:hypothetical protein QOZ91_003816, partial [Clostridium sardiniense]|uniref:hypothetical protein n=1 Tax=Clostridium sardiniense TaxID=29369 RepID=UPI00277FD6DB
SKGLSSDSSALVSNKLRIFTVSILSSSILHNLFGEDNIKILIKGISLLILYITTSFIFMDKYIETSNTK